jgi:tetratricopeptide (TPR) repeat protein
VRRPRRWLSLHDLAGLAIGVGCLVSGALGGSGEVLALGGIIVGGWALSSASTRARARRLQQLFDAIGWGDAERARRLWTRVQTELDPRLERQSLPQLIQAVILMLSDDWRGAQQIFASVSDTATTNVFHGARLRCLVELGDAQRAIELARTYLADDDLTPAGRASLQLALAVAHLRTAAPDKALRLVDELTPDLPHDGTRAAAQLVRGDALRALGREPEAVAAYQNAIALAPSSVSARHGRTRLTQSPPTAYR